MFDLNIQSLSVVALKGKLSRMNNKINQFHCMKWGSLQEILYLLLLLLI